MGDLTIARQLQETGWRWSTHVRPHVGGDWCQARHVGVIIAGRLGLALEDGTTFEFSAYDVYDVPPGHDAWVLGDEPCEV